MSKLSRKWRRLSNDTKKNIWLAGCAVAFSAAYLGVVQRHYNEISGGGRSGEPTYDQQKSPRDQDASKAHWYRVYQRFAQ